MMPWLKGLCKATLALCLLGLCFWYLASNLDLQRFSEALQRRPLWTYALAVVLFVPACLPQAVRFLVILEKRCSFSRVFRAVFLGSGVNALLPARLGDVAKAGYLALNCALPFPFTLCGVFWERLFDLVCVLLLALLLGATYAMPALWLTPLLMLGVILAGLLLVCRFPLFFHSCMNIIPQKRLRGQLNAIVAQVADRRCWPPPGPLLLLSLGVWLCFSVYNTFFLAFFQGAPPDFLLGTLVTAAGAIGMMVPGMPANLGIFEASVVAALVMAGQNKSEALAFALALHAVQVIPSVVFAVYAALRGQWSFASIGFSRSAEDPEKP